MSGPFLYKQLTDVIAKHRIDVEGMQSLARKNARIIVEKLLADKQYEVIEEVRALVAAGLFSQSMGATLQQLEKR